MAPSSGPPNLRPPQRDPLPAADYPVQAHARKVASVASPSPEPLEEQTIPRSLYGWATLLFCGFLMYGSLLPFNFTPKSWDEALERFRGMPYLTLSLGQERADWVATILLWAPAGFLAFGALAGRTASRPRKLAASVLLFTASATYAVIVEFTQIWFPPRTISQNDILAATAGGVVGTLCGLAIGGIVDQAAHGLWQSRDACFRGFWLLGAYTLALAIYALVPLDFVINAHELQEKISQGRCEWTPLVSVLTGVTAWYIPLLHVVCWLPVGVWIARLLNSPRSWTLRLVVAILAILILEVARFLVYSAHSSTTHLLAVTLGVLGGAIFARAGGLLEWLYQSRIGFGLRTSTWPLCALLLAHAAAILFFTQRAAEWNFDAQWMRTRWDGFFHAPLAAMYWNSKFGALENVVGKMAIYFPAGLLIAHAARLTAANERQRAWIAALGIAAVASVAATAEIAQVFLTRFHVDLTDVLLAAAGASLGLLVYRVSSGPAELSWGTTLIGLDADRPGASTRPARSSPWSIVSLFSLLIAGASVLAVAGYERVHTDAANAPAWMSLLDPSQWRHLDAEPTADDSAALAYSEAQPHTTPTMSPPLNTVVKPQAAAATITGENKPIPDKSRTTLKPAIDDAATEPGRRSPSAWFTRTPPDPFLAPKLTAAPWQYAKPITRIVSAPVRDRDGKLWFVAQESDEQSLQLVVYEPLTGHCESRGEFAAAWSASRSSDSSAPPAQVQPASSLVISRNGDVYFATSHQASTNGRVSHVWRVAATDSVWKTVLAGEFELTALAAGGESIYAWSADPPVLWRAQGDGQTWQRLELTAKGSTHGLRLFADDRGDAYVIEFPPVEEDLEEERPVLVQIDAGLREVGRSELPAHGEITDRTLFGAVGEVAFADGSRVFANDVGFLVKVTPGNHSTPSTVEPLGWLHPLGMSRVAMLSTYEGKRFVCGVGRSDVDEPPVNQWLVFDVTTGESRSAPLGMGDGATPPQQLSSHGARDHAGRFYFGVAGDAQPVRMNPHLRRALLAIGASRDDIESVAAESVIAAPSESLLLRVDFGVELDRE